MVVAKPDPVHSTGWARWRAAVQRVPCRLADKAAKKTITPCLFVILASYFWEPLGHKAVTVYGYARVRSRRPDGDSESFAAQQRAVVGYAMMMNMVLGHVFVERGVAGSTPFGERPEGSALLAALEAGDVVIAARLDRVFRSARDALDVLARLNERRAHLHVVDLGGDVTGTSLGKLVETILSAVNETDPRRVRERDVEVDERASADFFSFNAPFGSRLGAARARTSGATSRVMQDHAALASALRLWRSGAAVQTIQADMERRGHRLSLGDVHRLLHSEVTTPAGQTELTPS